jgi:hypothetical protein
MHIGTRKIRSAGRASGSIEITLPPELAPLEGLDCRLVLRDGARPELVLQPDIMPALAVFDRVWGRLRQLLALAGDIGPFPAQEFEVALFPVQGQRGLAVLSYVDALRLSPPAGTGGLSEEHRRERQGALTRVVAPLAMVAGRRLGLSGSLPAPFGEALARLAEGDHPVMAESCEVRLARQLWNDGDRRGTPRLNLMAAQADEMLAQQALRRIVSHFRYWQEHPDQYALARAEDDRSYQFSAVSYR